jgi:hypothetical protein
MRRFWAYCHNPASGSQLWARIGLVGLAAGALVGSYFPRVHVVGQLWPVTGHHPHLLPWVMVIVGYVVGAIVCVVVAAYGLRWLIEQAGWGQS